MMPCGLMSPALQQRNGRQQNARRVATRRGDERGLLDLLAINFGQAINGLRQQLGRGMVVRVEFLVNRPRS